jgi:EmrB/QacA subfamily drug resistance transporter
MAAPCLAHRETVEQRVTVSPALAEEGRSKNLILAAMIFAVAMMFIDQTIVAIAVPELQEDLDLSTTGVQWVVNGYLLALSALFAFGGRIADILGHRRMVIIGVIVFATASALCGATPTGDLAEPWMIVFRVIQGAGAAIMMPAALAIVIASFPVNERGKAMAIFFAITGGLTSIGPIAGGYLTEIDWRAIFWVNIPIAIIALALIAISKPENEKRPAPIDYRGAVLVTAGMALAVLGFQQAAEWGWGDARTIGCVLAGLALLAGFVAFERRQEHPLVNVRIFESRAFTVDNVVLFFLMVPFVPLFFFGSTYSQISLGYEASEAGLYLLVFFGGFATASQFGGRILDTRGARPAVVLGCAVAAIGLFLWAQSLPDLDFNNQWYFIALAGAGIGLVLGPANTDAINRASRASYGEVTGITQTVRNFGSSLGLAVLGSIQVIQLRSNLETTLGDEGFSKSVADDVAATVTGAGGGDSSNLAQHTGEKAKEIFAAIQLDYAEATEVVFYGMAGVMAVAFVVALIWMPGGKVDPEDPQTVSGEDAAPGAV